ncbi:MAG: acyl-ACP--UDP-N-acetylglucosamine O-acyltransferase [Alphaproteobacteria bacterium]
MSEEIFVHPTAIVSPTAKLGQGAHIGPYCIVGGHVALGNHVRLMAHVYLDGRTTIGDGTVIYPFASIGTQTQDKKYRGEPAELIIGSGNQIREHVTMNPGTEGGGMITRVGDNCLFMVASHVAHDCQIGNNVIMANNATLAGHVTVGDFAILGGLSGIHQFVRIGAHAMIGGMSAVESDVIPFGTVKGDRAYLAGLNTVGMERRGFNKDQVRELRTAYRMLFSPEGTMAERLDEVARVYNGQPLIGEVLDFIRAKTSRPLCQPTELD